jgi:hypothetical protein
MEELSAALLVDPQTGQRVESLGTVEHKRYLPVGATVCDVRRAGRGALPSRMWLGASG